MLFFSSLSANTLHQLYVLEYFLEKISEFTPNINLKYNKNYSKSYKSLKSTQNFYNDLLLLVPILIEMNRLIV